jgi:diaminopimelate epimerase
MKHRISFTKVSGAGNDFVLVDNMDHSQNVDWSRLARAVCSRHFGVGADGLLVIEPSSRHSFMMKYFNADGSHGGMCGNGGRCVARYAFLKGMADREMTFEALDHTYHASIDERAVTLGMKDISTMPKRLILAMESERRFETFFVDTGAPHVVLRWPQVGEADVDGFGRAIRHHEAVKPDGANVDFYDLAGEADIDLRTYERGVEGETLACGTGAVAAAVVGSIEWSLRPPIRVHVRSGETLVVNFISDAKVIHNVTLQGSAHLLYSGTIDFNSNNGTIGL